MKKKKKTEDSKAWASFRVRGIQTTLNSLAKNTELSNKVRMKLLAAIPFVEDAVDILDLERDANEMARRF